MIEKTPWIERRFTFDLPVSMFPNLIERVRGTPARVADRVRGLPKEALVAREGEKWSIQEHVGHLLDLEPLWSARLDDFDTGAEVLRAADMSNRKTHEANHNDRPFDEILAGLREERGGIVARLEAMDARAAARTSRHPRLDQPMRVLDLVAFVAEHDDHHLARISEIIARHRKAR
jgi:uncharacterized damage-inducible protein DinB